MLDVFGGNYCGKAGLQVSLFQNVLNLVEPGAGSDRQRISSGCGPDRSGGIREQYGLLIYRLIVVTALALYQRLQLCRRQRLRIPAEQGIETITIVQGKVGVEILFICEADAFFLSHLPEGPHVYGIVIRDHAVEIKDERANHERRRLT